MNGNYEFVKHTAREKQNAFTSEARNQRLARQAGSPGANRLSRQYFVQAGARFYNATWRVAKRAAGYRVNWKLLHWPGATSH